MNFPVCTFKKIACFTVLGSALFGVCAGRAAAPVGAIKFTFEGPPVQAPETSYAINQYTESGFIFKPLGPIDSTPPYRLARVGPRVYARPDNGTTFLTLAKSDSLEVYALEGEHFRVVSADLAEYSTVFTQRTTIGFRGYKADGSQVTAQFVTDGKIDASGPGVDFQKFSFPASFSDLVKMEATTVTFSMDNLVLDTKNIFPIDKARPALTVTGGIRQHSPDSRFMLRGTAKDDVGVARVEVRTGSGRFLAATGVSPWKSEVRLKPGRNVFTVRAEDYAGKFSRELRIVVIRN
jgi:hypothetical protein